MAGSSKNVIQVWALCVLESTLFSWHYVLQTFAFIIDKNVDKTFFFVTFCSS